MLLLKFGIFVYLCLKHIGWKDTAYANKSDIGDTRLKEK